MLSKGHSDLAHYLRQKTRRDKDGNFAVELVKYLSLHLDGLTNKDEFVRSCGVHPKELQKWTPSP